MNPSQFYYVLYPQYQLLPSYFYSAENIYSPIPNSDSSIDSQNNNQSSIEEKTIKRQLTGIPQQPREEYGSSEPQASIKEQKKPKKAENKKGDTNQNKQLQSAKKNSESNIVNQFFSFFSNKINCSHILAKIIGKLGKEEVQVQKISAIFYNIIRCISSQRGKKYVNKKTLLNFCQTSSIEKQIPGLEQKLEKLDFISVFEICAIFRRCSLHYLRNQCTLSIVASKRISAKSKKEHLKRRRIILFALKQKNSEQM